LLFAILTLIAALPAASTAHADTVYPYWGTTKTYQNNQNSDCRWYDVAHDSMSDQSCYQGVWSDTTTYSYYGGQASVQEYALKQSWAYAGGAGNYTIQVFYAYFGSQPSYASGNPYATTNHFYAGDAGGQWPVNVIGEAYHYGPSGAPSAHTSALWGAQYIY